MYTLYHHPFCPHSRFIRLALGEHGLDLRLVEERAWERREGFLLLNPAAATPVLMADGFPPIPGAGIIAEYLDETHGLEAGDWRLLPASMAERVPAASLPCPSALGATWDPELVAAVTSELAREARSKGIDVLLGPTINLMRTPLGGRGFECFSEDPLLTAHIATGCVTGLQDGGVAATLKHFVCNDSETGRQSLDVRVDERTLRELYRVPFEACVEAGS